MFASPEVIDCMKSVIGWKNFYDPAEIPALTPTLNETESGEFYQDYHPALRLDIIKAAIPDNKDLSEYLAEKVTSGTTQMINDIVSSRKYEQYAKKTLANDMLLDKYGWKNDTILSKSRFVGFEIKTKLEIGLKLVVKSIGFQFVDPQTDLDIYIYHSSQVLPVKQFKFTSTTGVQWNWRDEIIEMKSESKDYSGGVWVIGYYQDDLAGEAINYTEFNWKKGPCTTCSGDRKRVEVWRNLMRFMDIVPVYVPNASFTKGEMYDLNASMPEYNTSWGLNLKLTAECDLSRFFCEHRLSMKQALGLKVTYMILKDLEYTQQINFVEESMKSLIIRDLEGDTDTNYVNITDRYMAEIKAVNFDHSKISGHCLPCDSKRGPNYRVA